MESETYRFISLIEKHPQLYNKKHKDFLRQDIRNTIWDSICKEMNWDDTNKAKKKWRNLRDKFVKKRRRHGSGSNSNEDESQREFYNSLMFLDGHVNSRNARTSQGQTTSGSTTNTVISTTTTTQQPQYVQVSTNQIPIEHINLEYLSGVNVTEDAQCLLDISNNTNAIANHQHPPPQPQQTQQIQTQPQSQQHQTHGQPQHQSLAAQHIQQFKIEFQDQLETSMDEKISLNQVCHQEGEEVIVQQCEVENATYDAQTHTLTPTSTTLAPIPTAIHRAHTTNSGPKKIYHQVINSNGLITTNQHQIVTAQIKRPRIEVADQQDIGEAITAAVDYYKQQTAIADADAAFAKYILEELREMNKKRKNEFKRMVTTWLTTEEDDGHAE
ncbi:cAMP-dependent protein kinase catalytic subunit-like [Sitodiplosis mosellana]|uniref:cAMP-dependent protein kinase catalytic subunit-like n=1 Tax=Sitodiplosis mosellana TaxID=263140 RepID=UPI002443F805|nr:cAMP-dependent protein kinase catalytic subunit-like [Sitodiplosis mosellana]XP_055301288.1 cAMP-dependent protein kinase catalytic subunit-like [Sitodiplosis mosellana]XP_055301289.1 cAMP-dependent protein kinase catalytic subunit-like [Sitodiplosis mosellana]XP_055301291.1 cAMP-dependent protein kinase catalytic subunit-like [Sitodiplosis mosellana]XP_055301292.1 cAMP-dependent protein kinase catalytic subunit-like [Sitodiplosis mosellana]XP_055301293.1 cAMP-dependent protein kinase catal